MTKGKKAIRLLEVLRPECVEVRQSPADKDAALRLVEQIALRSPALENVDIGRLHAAFTERESIGTTGFGQGIAIPHCRIEGLEEFIVGFVTIPGGVDFKSLDNNPVTLISFIIAPAENTGDHVHILSEISQALMIPGAIKEIVSATNAEAARESFLRHARDEIEPRDHKGKNIIHVFIQNEEWFEDILQVFTGLNAHSVAVEEGHSPAMYLKKMPLFSGFWTDSERDFMRIIVAVLDKKLANEAIRRIERITGPLNETESVLLTVQEVFYAAGSLRV